MERLREVITYVEEHFREPITLDDITALLGLGKEYFCRFFKSTWECLFFSISMKYESPISIRI